MKPFFRRLFNIYSGEERQALLVASLGFLWSLGATLGQKFADALFLIHLGAESLPIAYAFAACTMMVMTAFYLKVFHLIPIQRIFTAILFVGVCFYIFVYICFATHIAEGTQWFFFSLKIFGTALFAIILTCFWTFIDQYFHLQDAKRLFSLFTASIFCGAITTGVIMRSGLIAFQNIAILIILLFFAAMYGIRIITRSINPVYDESIVEETSPQQSSTYRALFQAILRSKFTLILMTGNFLSYVLLVITEYSYLSAFDQRFDPGITAVLGGEEKALLTQFLGQCLAVVSIFNLIFGLFFYSRLVRQFGVSNLILCTPVILVLTFSGWLGMDTLLFPLLGFFVVEGLAYSVDDNNFNLLLHAVPQKMKYKIRVLIESFSEPTGMLVSSLLISILPINTKILGLILSLCALIVALFLRRQYVKAIFINLSENAIHFQRSLRDWFLQLGKRQQESLENRLLSLLSQENEQTQNFAMEAVIGLADSTLFSKILDHVDPMDAHSKVIFLQHVMRSQFTSDPRLIGQLQQWQEKTNDAELKSHLSFCLACQGQLPPYQAKEDLDKKNLTLKGASIVALKRSWPDLPPKAASQNRTLADQQLKALLDSSNEEEVRMGVRIIGLDTLSQDINTLLPFLKHPNIAIAREAAQSISQIVDAQSLRYGALLIAHLTATSDTEIRQSVLRALGKIGDSSYVKEIISRSMHFRPNERRLTESIIAKMDTEIAPILLAITQDTSMNDRCRMLAARILARLDLPLLQTHFYDIVSAEIKRAYFYFYYSQTIQEKYPDLDLGLLQDALRSSFHSVLDFIIQLLGMGGESEDSELLSKSLRSPNPKIRSNVIETLERTCETRIYRVLYPLIADLPESEKMHAATRNIETTLSLSELLDKMSISPMAGDQIIAIAFKYRLDIPGWRESLRKQLASKEEMFHHFAYELLEP